MTGLAAHVQATVAAAPPLDNDQLHRLGALLQPFVVAVNCNDDAATETEPVNN